MENALEPSKIGYMHIILFALLFVISWLGFIVTTILNMIVRKRISKILNSDFPNIKNINKVGGYRFSNSKSFSIMKDLVLLHLSFGKTEKSERFINNFIGIESLRIKGDIRIKGLIERHINYTSLATIFSNLMIISFIIAVAAFTIF